MQRKYNGLFKFQEEREGLESELLAIKAEQAREAANHEVVKAEMEKKNMMEKEVLKREMLRRIKETKLTLLAMTQDTLHPTTKRTQQENEQMTTELAFQSRECEKLLQKNRYHPPFP
jgi:hypothetical protein